MIISLQASLAFEEALPLYSILHLAFITMTIPLARAWFRLVGSRFRAIIGEGI
jgi:hypothetical protein